MAMDGLVPVSESPFSPSPSFVSFLIPTLVEQLEGVGRRGGTPRMLDFPPRSVAGNEIEV